MILGFAVGSVLRSQPQKSRITHVEQIKFRMITGYLSIISQLVRSKIDYFFFVFFFVFVFDVFSGGVSTNLYVTAVHFALSSLLFFPLAGDT